MVLGPFHGDTKRSNSIHVEDGVVALKIDAVAITSMKRGRVEFYYGWPYPTSITSVINTSTARVLTLTPSHFQSLYIEVFTLHLTGTLSKTSEGQHRTSCSPNLEES